jgi:DNA-binding response OmpR family regulator
VLDVVQAISYLTRPFDGYGYPRPDLIILDLMLPIFSGKVFLEERRFREFCRWIPVVVMTSGGDERTVCLGLGAEEYREKPLEWAEWQELICHLVERYLAIELRR